MCGRYYISLDDGDLSEIISEVKRNIENTLTLKTSGEVFPGDTVPVILGSRQYTAMKWGFAGFDGKLIINARSETAANKPMFREAMSERRCLIPASGYFEWAVSHRRQKVKYYFHAPNGTMHLAGCWRQEQDERVFVILTRDAVNGCKTVHDRMPVIIPHTLIDDWLDGSTQAMERSVTELVFEETDNVQQRLFD
jgi:putative SOS response-associated peptidase YedK